MLLKIILRPKVTECWSKANFGGVLAVPKVAQSDGVLVESVLWGRFGIPKVAQSDGALVKNILWAAWGSQKLQKVMERWSKTSFGGVLGSTK